MTGPASPEEQRGYRRGYTAGRKRLARDSHDEEARTKSARLLFECLVEGLVLQGFSLDAILDAQLAGAMARAEERRVRSWFGQGEAGAQEP